MHVVMYLITLNSGLFPTMDDFSSQTKRISGSAVLYPVVLTDYVHVLSCHKPWHLTKTLNIIHTSPHFFQYIAGKHGFQKFGYEHRYENTIQYELQTTRKLSAW